MKLVSHGKKLKRFEVCHEGLILAFVERWRRETNSFHLPFGEMTVTLYDAFVLLHLPIVG